LAPAASPSADEDEARLVELVNAERTSGGLAPVAADWAIGQVARGWTAQMAAAGSLAHNPAYAAQIWASLPCGAVAENVGFASSLDQVHAALMNSPAHRANILNPAFSRIGVGVAADGSGRLWVTEDFCG
jgi:uncharacterized protein YkwD